MSVTIPITTVGSTVLRNTSGVNMYFGYLGMNGAYLLAGQDVSVPGDIWTTIWRSQMKYDALRCDIENGTITILQSEVNYQYDYGVDKVYSIQASSGTLSANYVLPTGGSYVGPIPNPGLDSDAS